MLKIKLEKELKIKMDEIGKRLGYKIKVIHVKRFKIRIILAGFFIKLGAKILPCDSMVEISHIEKRKV